MLLGLFQCQTTADSLVSLFKGRVIGSDDAVNCHVVECGLVWSHLS